MPNQWIQCFVRTCVHWEDANQCELDRVQIGSRYAWWIDVKHAITNAVPEERDTYCQDFMSNPSPRNPNGMSHPKASGC